MESRIYEWPCRPPRPSPSVADLGGLPQCRLLLLERVEVRVVWMAWDDSCSTAFLCFLSSPSGARSRSAVSSAWVTASPRERILVSICSNPFDRASMETDTDNRRFAPTSVHLRRNPRSRSAESVFNFSGIHRGGMIASHARACATQRAARPSDRDAPPAGPVGPWRGA